MGILGLAIWILFASSAQAEPSRSIRYLMNEPVSLLEWGMYRLQIRAESFAWDELDISKQFAAVDYDWSKNQLSLRLVVYPRFRSLQKTTPKQICGSVVRQTKAHFGVQPGFEFMKGFSGIGTFFRHKDFAKSDAPSTLDSDVEAITKLEVKVMTSKSDQPPSQEAASCSSDLLAREIRYFTTSETGR